MDTSCCRPNISRGEKKSVYNELKEEEKEMDRR